MKNIQYSILIILLLLLPKIVSAGQKNKNFLAETSDTIWSINTALELISDDGKWLIIKEVFPHKTLVYLVDQEGKEKETFINPKSYSISKDNKWLGILTQESQLHIISLRTKTVSLFSSVINFSFSPHNSFLAILNHNDYQDNFIMLNLEDGKKVKMNGVKDYMWSPIANTLLFSQKTKEETSISMLDVPKNSLITIYRKEGSEIKDIQFNNKGNSLGFKEFKNNEFNLFVFSVEFGLKSLINTRLKEYLPKTEISEKEFFISDDGNKVYFFREKCYKKQENNHTEMEVWETNTPWIFPKKMLFESFYEPFLLTLWNVPENKVNVISDEDNPSYFLNPGNLAAYTFNPITYEPNYKESEYIDIYYINLANKKKNLAIKKVYNQEGFINQSSSGRYLVYFKNNNWHVFDAVKNEVRNLTGLLKNNFTDFDDSPLIEKKPYGMAGWYDYEKYIILYDEFDIWLFSPDGKSMKKLTNGRKTKQTFRLNTISKRYSDLNNLTLKYNISPTYKADETLIIEMKDQRFYSGLYYFKNYKIKEQIAFKQKNIKGIAVSANEKIIFFSESFFNSPPKISAYNLKDKSTKLIFQSNTDLLSYESNLFEIMNYVDKGNRTLNNVLLYPKDYDSRKNYPMIVWIYEKNSAQINHFYPPIKYNYIGFNILDYLTKGYFILLPDISYELKKPGESSLTCVELAVNNALESEKSINKSAIGLIGHSFGGYETLFIATHSKMFKTAIAGSAVSDLKSWYHDVSWSWYKDQMWRLENQQYRLGYGYYENKDVYKTNSPLNYVEKLEIPLLIWTGKNDSNVNWSQSLSFFMAMKRLNKKGKLLLFPNEGHAIMKKENQTLLYDEIFKWFDVFLK
jgi:dipeptidyl aminopeptidase/acylaminoacyl peptidase